MTTLAPAFLIGSSLFLQVIRTAIKFQMILKFGRIGPRTYELAALERLEKSPFLQVTRPTLKLNFGKISSLTKVLAALERLKSQ